VNHHHALVLEALLSIVIEEITKVARFAERGRDPARKRVQIGAFKARYGPI
jgi:hypothetical protein